MNDQKFLSVKQWGDLHNVSRNSAYYALKKLAKEWTTIQEGVIKIDASTPYPILKNEAGGGTLGRPPVYPRCKVCGRGGKPPKAKGQPVGDFGAEIGGINVSV